MPALCSYLYSGMFRVAQWSCSENESSSWTEIDTCSPTNNRGQAMHPRPLLPTHLFPFVSQITLGLLSPWVGQKEIFSHNFLFVKLCYCLVTHHKQECSPFSTHKPACPLPLGTPGILGSSHTLLPMRQQPTETQAWQSIGVELLFSPDVPLTIFSLDPSPTSSLHSCKKFLDE